MGPVTKMQHWEPQKEEKRRQEERVHEEIMVEAFELERKKQNYLCSQRT